MESITKIHLTPIRVEDKITSVIVEVETSDGGAYMFSVDPVYASGLSSDIEWKIVAGIVQVDSDSISGLLIMLRIYLNRGVYCHGSLDYEKTVKRLLEFARKYGGSNVTVIGHEQEL